MHKLKIESDRVFKATRGFSLVAAGGSLASRLIVAAACAVVSVGCSDDGLDDVVVEGDQTAISAVEAAHLPFRCDGAVVKAAPVAFEHSGISLTPYECVSKKAAGFMRFIGADGDVVDWDEMRSREAIAYRDVHHRMNAALEEKLARTVGAAVRASLWFGVSEEASPSRGEWTVMSEEQKKHAQQAARVVVQRHAEEMSRRLLDSVPSLQIVPKSPGLLGQAPYLVVEATPSQLRQVGQLDGITTLGVEELPEEEQHFGEDWFDVDKIDSMQSLGWDGSGVIVAHVEGEAGLFDSTYLNMMPGDCQSPQGPSYHCYCPGAAPLQPDPSANLPHSQLALGFISNNHPDLRGGAAAGATLIFGNTGGSVCGASTADAIDWAANEGASVINRSAGTSAESLYMDWVSSHSPFPTFVVSAGNDAAITPKVASSSMNAIVVGNADDHGSPDPANATLNPDSRWQNPSGGVLGLELPHFLAPGTHVTTVPKRASGGLSTGSGTSFSAPQVSGLVAALQEKNPDLKGYAPASLAILLVSGTRSIYGSGSWLSLSDGVDDHDGTGLVDALNARRCEKVDGGAVSNHSAMDYGFWTSSSLPAGTTYGEIWNARAAAGRVLRVALKVEAMPSTCSDGDAGSCGALKWPRVTLTVRKGSSTWTSSNANNSYQYLAVPNNTSSSAFYTIEARVDSWDGLTVTGFGLAWSSEG